MQNFIVQFEQALNPQFCRDLIQKFESDQNKAPGSTGAGVDIKKKNSTDLIISNHPDWKEAEQTIQNTLFRGLLNYARIYPHFIVGAISSKFQDPTNGQLKEVTAEQIKSMPDQQLGMLISNIYQLEPINLQKYQPKVGGYPYLHSEHFPHPNDPQQRSLHRVLLWLIYLNDVEEGGETEFVYQNAKIKPKTGNLIFSPCGFTHTHCGHTPISGEKYVLASWVGFKPASQMYRAG